MIRIDLEILIRCHVIHVRVVAQRLVLHDLFHIRRPTILGSDNAARTRDESIRNDDLLHLVSENVLDRLA